MKRTFSWVLLLLTSAILGFTACSETEVEDTEYTNWQARNTTYFTEQLTRATEAVMRARQTYGETWAEQTPWRAFRTYKLTSAPTATHEDSIAVEIIKHGAGQTKVLFSDSVTLRYRGVLMPTTKHPDGFVFSHSGLYEERERVFDMRYAGITGFRVQTLTEGLATALMYMVEGDRWRVYVPAKLAYAGRQTSAIPPYSTLIFEVEVESIYNANRNEK